MSKDQSRRSLSFPKFLIPSFPTKHTTTTSTTHSPPPINSTSNGSKYLTGHLSYLHCTTCAAHLCLTSQIISKGFTGRHGRAYLVSAEPVASAVSVSASSSPTVSLPNTILQHPVPRQLVTGAHTVSDVSCAFCGTVLGWKYVAAEEESQRYKVGKFILETKKITASSCWEALEDEHGDGDGDRAVGGGGSGSGDESEDKAEFDSQDEDECEDLFAGIWSPGLASRRRSRKIERRPATAIFGIS
ncbi:uncharacterized protein N7473_012901 [Penicillium subrubescens]|uniref:Protein yippee-like n=1 Tax=Penicillium subrubescens TaxID=1316194 RepID=A0A1Q5T6J9_9EURO|nr:uncharacterized protein N7473_012901 [Penicillium subrubescens]KAJ5875554.1 hypothetical protein N7473_012901 [Penicillium subrubescens]OKO95859.1 Protein yippee-like [Penicillium subrubescens]